jgi:SAM-dependent methyltransferase
MFSKRSDKLELLDAEEIPFSDIERNLRELHVINRYLGGYSVSKDAFRYLFKKGRPEVLVDIGSGGGELLADVREWGNSNGYALRLVGVDKKKECVAYSINKNPVDISFVCDDYRNVLNHVPDATVLHASLFCHHLNNYEITALIRFAVQNRLTLVINDLSRHPVAYYSISLLTKLFSRSKLVKNDAPLSVLRGFTRKEWESLIQNAGVKNYRIRNCWAFRHQVIVHHEQ